MGLQRRKEEKSVAPTLMLDRYQKKIIEGKKKGKKKLRIKKMIKKKKKPRRKAESSH